MSTTPSLRALAGRVICWDLDKTLGIFRALGRDRPGPRPPGPEQGLRPHVLEVISSLDEAGALQVITTASTRAHAERSLRRAGLRQHVRRVYTGDELVAVYGAPNKVEIATDSDDRPRVARDKHRALVPGVMGDADGVDRPLPQRELALIRRFAATQTEHV